MADEKHCPTCRTMQPFRPVTPAEEDYIASRKGRAEAAGYWRCAKPGCLWVQPYFSQAKGFSLPLAFR